MATLSVKRGTTEICVGPVPGRRRPAVYTMQGNTAQVLGCLRDAQARRLFEAALLEVSGAAEELPARVFSPGVEELRARALAGDAAARRELLILAPDALEE